jgi:hypothetical protein
MPPNRDSLVRPNLRMHQKTDLRWHAGRHGRTLPAQNHPLDLPLQFRSVYSWKMARVG